MRYHEIDGTRYYDLRSDEEHVEQPKDTSGVDLAFILFLSAVMVWALMQMGLRIPFIS